MATAAQVIGAILAIATALGLAFVVSFRRRVRPVLTVVRRLNRAFLNPRQLRQAGQPGAWASIVHHAGRSSGRPYRTPVVAVPADGDFVIALPYGPGADWVRNVMAAGKADLEHEGRTVPVVEPEVVAAAEVGRLFAPKERRMQRMYGVDRFLRLRRRADG